MIKGIIFDLDGTLVRLPIKYDKIFVKLQNLFNTSEKFQPLIPMIIKKANGNQKLIDKSFDLICEEEENAVNNFEIIDDAIEILNYFKNEKYVLTLVTMQCQSVAKSILRKMGVIEMFSDIITREDSSDRVTQIERSIKALSLNPNEVVMVGDRIHDVRSANQVGCAAILSNKNKMGSFNESYVIPKLIELKKLI